VKPCQPCQYCGVLQFAGKHVIPKIREVWILAAKLEAQQERERKAEAQRTAESKPRLRRAHLQARPSRGSTGPSKHSPVKRWIETIPKEAA
jgi:hypothetical protein